MQIARRTQAVVLALAVLVLVSCSRRKPRLLPTANPDAPGEAAKPKVVDAKPSDECRRFSETGTPWSGGGPIRSLEPEAILEPAVRQAADAGLDPSWTVVEAPTAFDLPDGRIALVSLEASQGAAVLSLSQAKVGYCIVGVWFELFGGAGAHPKLAAHEKSFDGYRTFAAYALTEGWRAGGQTSWECHLVTMGANHYSLEEVHKTPEHSACREPPLPVHFERKKRQLVLWQGRASWKIDDLSAE